MRKFLSLLRPASSARRLMVIGPAAAVAVALLLFPSEAGAHALEIFAAAQGNTISGEAYFASDAKARHVRVMVYGPDGTTLLGQTETDDEGRFTFSAKYRCDHIVEIRDKEGHRATYTVRKGEFEKGLPDFPGPSERDDSDERRDLGARSEESAAAADRTLESPGRSEISIEERELERIVEDVVARHVAPLHEEIELYRLQVHQYQSKVRVHDVVGGIGYILGLMGVVFLFKGANRKRDI